MEAEFWHDKWTNREIGFHRADINPLLGTYWDRVTTDRDARVFVPLCGKSLDIGYLHSMGHEVVAVELSRSAIEEWFQERDETPEVADWHGGQCWSGSGITIYEGDFFQLRREDLGRIDAVYDRASLIALPPPMRALYANRITALTNNAPQLLITTEYDQNQMDGPPFSVPADEVRQRYGDYYQAEELTREDVLQHSEHFREKGLDSMVNVAWLLHPGAS